MAKRKKIIKDDPAQKDYRFMTALARGLSVLRAFDPDSDPDFNFEYLSNDRVWYYQFMGKGQGLGESGALSKHLQDINFATNLHQSKYLPTSPTFFLHSRHISCGISFAMGSAPIVQKGCIQG